MDARQCLRRLKDKRKLTKSRALREIPPLDAAFLRQNVLFHSAISVESPKYRQILDKILGGGGGIIKISKTPERQTKKWEEIDDEMDETIGRRRSGGRYGACAPDCLRQQQE